MKFERVPLIVEATQWFKNGDHPRDYEHDRQVFENGAVNTKPASFFKDNKWEGEIVRYFRRPDVSGTQMCAYCDKEMNLHGWIDDHRNGGAECTVCPGDWIITGELGEIYPCKDVIFRRNYRPVN